MKCRRCGESVYVGNAYCQTCSDAMARRAQELESAAVEKNAKPKRAESPLLRTVAWVTVAGAVLSISPYLFFRAQEKVASAGQAFGNLTEVRTDREARDLARRAGATLSIGRAQRTASLDAAEKTGTDVDGAPISTDSEPEPGTGVNKFPLPVSQWVAHLQEFEHERQTLALSQLTAASDSTTGASELGSQFKTQWIQLLSRFEKDTAPDQCQELAAAFSRTLRETGAAVVGKVTSNGHSTTVSSNPDSTVTVMVAPAEDADQLYHDLCMKYGSSKDFSIESLVKTATPR